MHRVEEVGAVCCLSALLQARSSRCTEVEVEEEVEVEAAHNATKRLASEKVVVL